MEFSRWYFDGIIRQHFFHFRFDGFNPKKIFTVENFFLNIFLLFFCDVISDLSKCVLIFYDVGFHSFF
jgi:hypothetical protein